MFNLPKDAATQLGNMALCGISVVHFGIVLVFSVEISRLMIYMGARRVPRRRALVALRSPEPAERFPPIRVTIPWRRRCYNFCMTSEIDSLQERVDAIRATGNAELAARAWHALSSVLFSYTREKRRVRKFPIIKRVTVDDVERFLSDLAEKASGRAQ